MKKQRRLFVPCFDRLEDRTVPAGNVQGSVIGGTLYLYGDDEANHLSIVRNGNTGITVTSGQDATTINGQEGPVNFSNVTRGITVKLFGGDDHLEITGISLSREIAVSLGDGDDVLKLQDIHAKLHSTIIGGNGDDQITILDSVFSKKLDLFGQAGDDTVSIINTKLGKKSNINGGSGSDDFIGAQNTWGARSKLDLFQSKTSSTNPLAFNDAQTLNEGAEADIDVAANDSALTGTLDLTSITITSQPTRGTLVVNNDGTVTYTHNGSETTSDTFKYTIKDSNGHTSSEAAVTLTITPVNDLPIAVNDTATVAEGGTVSIPVAANDSDPDGTLNLASILITQLPAHGTATVNSNGTVTYVHNGTETTTDTFKYTIKDNSGFASEAATVNITITPVNDAPVAVNDTATVEQGSSVIIPVSTNDTDADGTIDLTSIVITTQPTHGTLTVNADGTVTYLHSGTGTATDTFAYTIKDNNAATSNAATVTITVTPLNQAPIAVDDSGTVDEGGSVTINVPNNDSDPDGSLALNTVTIVQQPSHGSLTIDANGQITYQHDGSETATTDTYTYTIRDNEGKISNQATVTITINLLNDAPVANEDAGTVAKGGSVNINLAQNDTDADGTIDLASIVIVDSPLNGSVTVNNDGTVTYQHNDSATTADVFTYTIKDNLGLVSAVGTVRITITA
ncbi:MAG: Ig-like domain-containing protein [Gemmatales bacterium]